MPDRMVDVFGPPSCVLPVEQVPPTSAEALHRLRTDCPSWGFLPTPGRWWRAPHHSEVISRQDPAALRAQAEARAGTRRPL